MLNDYHKKAAMKQFQLINKKAYPIIRCKAENAMEESNQYIKQTPIVPDIIFFDLPGTANTKGVLTTLKSMDFIFAPMTADRLVVESTLDLPKLLWLFLPVSMILQNKRSGYSGIRLMDGKRQDYTKSTKKRLRRFT